MYSAAIILFVAVIDTTKCFAPTYTAPWRQTVFQKKMVAASSDSFGDDLPERNMNQHFGKGKVNDSQKRVKFVTGDELHKLRHDVMAMKLELQEARRSGSKLLVRALEQAIIQAQQVDAEFVYTISKERQAMAEEKAQFEEAEKHGRQAKEARNALPQFGMEGLWVGKYGEHGYEMINVTYSGDVLVARKVTGTKNVPKGQATFEVDLSPKSGMEGEILEPIKLGKSAAKQWGSKYLQRFVGKGQIAAEGYHDSQWVDGQLILVNEYFSFAWLPIGHQVFFGRPTPELILKLMKEDQKKESGDCSMREFLEQCWDETQHIEDDREVTEGFVSGDETEYFHQDGCFQ